MKFYQNRSVQLLISILYPVVAFALLHNINSITNWTVILCFLPFCALWRNVWYVLLSSVITLAITIPAWIISFHVIRLTGYPLLALDYCLFFALPEIVVVMARNLILRRLFKLNV